MIDFNHEKITEQEKQDFLTQQIDPEYKKKRKEFGYIPFSGAWIITYKMLQMLNKAALENEGILVRNELVRYKTLNRIILRINRTKKLLFK